MIPKTVVFFLLVAWITDSTLAQSTKCPQKGRIGAPLPDIFQGINPSNGYHIRVELAGSGLSFTEVEDYYNGATKHGRIQINDENGWQEIHYYSMTNETFTLDKDKKCDAKKLDDTKKVSIVNSWLKSDDIIKALSSSLQSNNLGPGALLMYVNSIKDRVQDLSGNGATIDGQQVNQLFYCVNDNGPYIEFNFNTKNQPINMILSFPDRPEITQTINFISMEPVIPQKVEPTSYPWGFGCIRRVDTSSVVVPHFTESDAFYTEMEAAVFLSSDRVSVLQNAKLAKSQGTYAYVVTSGNQTTRIVKPPKLDVDYVVDPVSGNCSKQESRLAKSSVGGSLRWPYIEDEQFNLLDSDLLELGWVGHLMYMGQTDTEFGRMDIFEKTREHFFLNEDNEHYGALITYFFPVMEAVKERHQAPHKIIIKPLASDEDMNDPSFVTKIELVFIDYREENIDYTDLFDISGCFDEPGKYTWFQIVFSDMPSNILQNEAQEELIRHEFDKAISLFIPRIRLSEIRITYFGPNIYITCKLFERLGLEHFFFVRDGYLVSNAMNILVTENEEDCGQLCSQSGKCLGFSYCSNRECRIADSSDYLAYLEKQEDCIGYKENPAIDYNLLPIEKNLMKSSKTILHEIKQFIEKGKLSFDSPAISAEDLFIVNGPDVIGGLDDELNENNPLPNGDAFSVVLNNHKLNEGYKFLGVTYQQCLIDCVNDDECYQLSYCPSKDGGECILSYPPPEVSEGSSKPDYPLSTGCNILSKNFTNYFRKLPGRSLVLSSQVSSKNIGLEDCAKMCELSKQFNCESFDYCPSLLNNQDEKSESACFQHSFHVAKDVSQEMNGTVWNFADGECDHYSRKHSQDYKQYIGRRLKVNFDLILGQADDVPLEHCAINCDSAEERCESFEFCQLLGQQDNPVITTCRYSKYRPSTGRDEALETSTDLCSIYVAKNNIQKTTPNSESDTKSDTKSGTKSDTKSETKSETRSDTESNTKSGLGLAMGLGSFMMITGFAVAVVGSHFYFKRQIASS